MNRRQTDYNTPEPLPVDPTPFSVKEHGSRYRRSHRENCDTRYILSVIDASGSIRENVFNRVTDLLGELVLYFCGPIKVTAMTFDHRYFAEFCFDEYGLRTRNDIETAINSIDYNSRRDLTHTAGAARCACDYMLSQNSCSLPVDARCIDVIFLTDGRANDPSRDICTEIQCLHNRRGVDTFVLGVGNYDTPRLDCYGNDNLDLDEYHLFNFPNFTKLEQEFEIVKQKLLNNYLGLNDYDCASIGANPRA